MAQTILISGAGGYIGQAVTRALKEGGNTVLALDVEGPCPVGADDFIQADAFAPNFDLANCVPTLPDACLHLAWRNGFDHKNPSNIEDLPGHYRFLSGLVKARVPRVAVMGSVHEVGYWEGPINEGTPCNPMSLYGIAKDTLRRAFLLEAANSGTRPLWLRGFYIYGNDERSQSIFGKIARASAQGQKAFPFTTGMNKYDFIHIDELAEQIAACILQDDETGIINCCTGNPVSLAEQVEAFIADNGFDITLEYGAFPDRPYDSPGIWGDATRIRRIMANRK